MKKTNLLFKLAAIMIAVMMTVSVSACGRVIEDDVPDGRTLIKISLYCGGWGTEYMDKLIDRMNESQETYWYSRTADNKSASDEIRDKILGGVVEADIYVTTPADVEELVVKGKLEDLSDVYNYTVPGESKSIKEKTMSYDFYQSTFSDANGIYVMPNSVSLNSIVYDHDLFSLMEWLITDDETASGLSAGADGVEGNWDDGLPVTYEEYKNLFKNIADDQYIPFVYADTLGFDQYKFTIEAAWAQYEGLENYAMGAMFNGTYTSVSDSTKTITVTPETGYKVYTENLQEGRFKAMQIVYECFENTKYMYTAEKGLTHTDAQGKFILSHKMQNRIAMLLDGCWWENEAKRNFAEDAKYNGAEYAYGARDFRSLPVPAFDGQNAESNCKHYFYGGAGGATFAVKQSDSVKRQGVIEFLRAYASDENCKQYTKLTGGKFPFEYTMTDSELQELTPYARNVFEILSDPNVVLVDPYKYEKMSSLAVYPERWGKIKITGKGTWTTHLAAIRASGVSLSDYIKGVTSDTYNAENWTTETN